MKKRLVSFLLAISMVLTFLPVSAITAFAADNSCGDNLTYELTKNGQNEEGEDIYTLTISGNGAMSDYTYGEAPWFDTSSSITQVVFENGVTSIGDNAFSYTQLKKVSIPNSVTSIGDSAFNFTQLEEVSIPNSVTSIGKGAFSYTQLKEVSIPNSVISIGDNAFSYTQLKEVSIPDSVTSIGKGAFFECSEITSFKVADANDTFSSDKNGILYEKSTNGKVLRFYPRAKTDAAVTIPDDVTSIDDSAFLRCANLTSVIIPDSVISIGEHAFEGCEGLTNVTVPDNVVSIGTSAFSGCAGLTSVTIPNSVISIGSYTFENCDSLTDIYYTGNESNWNTISQNANISNSVTVHYVHSVTFKNNNNIIATKLTDENEKVTVPQDPTKEGYTFVGWSTDGTDKDWTEKELFNPDNSITENTTLYAVWKRVPAALNMTVAQGEHKVNEPVEVTVAVAPNDYSDEISNGKVVLTYDDDVKSVTVNGNELTKKEYTIPELYQYFQQSNSGINAALSVTYSKSGSHDFKIELKDTAGKTLCSDTATIEIAEEPTKPTNPEKPADSEKPDPKPEEPEAPVVKLYDLTVKNAEVTIADADGKAVETTKNEDGTLTAKVPEKAAVTVKYTAPTDAIVFDLWSITSDAKLDVNVKENPLTFTMPDKAVTVEAMTRDATIESDGPGVLGTAAMIGVGVAGTAVLGYQGYMIGTELYLKNVMPAGAAIPTNTAELAKLVWNDAGRPEPIALLAADATDEQKALTWAVENQLISADKAADASVTRWEVIQTWNKEQEMKKV